VSFIVDGKEAFQIPLDHVSQATHLKNEVTLEFHQDDTAALENSLVEMKFHIPPFSMPEERNSSMLISSASIFHTKVTDKANVVSNLGGGIVKFTNMQILIPRGRYDVEMFPSFMKLHGKTYDYKILYSSISRLFLLPRPDGIHVTFVCQEITNR